MPPIDAGKSFVWVVQVEGNGKKFIIADTLQQVMDTVAAAFSGAGVTGATRQDEVYGDKTALK